ncbi:Type I secretion system ATP-binding protein PrsD [Tsuneonella dongtanensis]|uniref:Type I secretion system ATP-binding protein PrsD n=1 Tax=Tsuneonella dongtanensis TaxID=692370 RepID=A0A1B2AGC3_9SPHN|nr:type I secretion system permease/ATPase [Tsuneonella dongtanensis]ANY21197.1 Type I secretion system ATP-binding protein PrsD [Tsuneonella dongtanensis]
MIKIDEAFESPTIAAAFRACRTHFAAAAAASFLLNLLFLAPAIYMLQVYDRVVATGGKLTLLYITIALLLALATLALLDALRGRILIRAGSRLNRELAPRVLRKIASGGNDAVGAEAVRDLDTVRQTVGGPLAAAMLDAPWTPVFIVVSFLLHPWLGLFALAATAVLLALALRNEHATRAQMDGASRALGRSYASQQIVAARAGTVRALGMREPLVTRQLADRAVSLDLLQRAQFIGGRYSAAIRFFRLFAQSAALGIGALLAIDGKISAGAIVAASILLGRALQPVEALVSGWTGFSSALTALRNLAGHLPGDPADDAFERTRLPAPTGLIEVENLVVRAPDGSRPILAGATLRAAPGEILGIIGPSGSGKTTLARVIAGALQHDLGSVRIDGAPYDAWDQDELGAHIGFMPQEPSLLDGTVKENISRFAEWRGDDAAQIDARTVAAAQAAGIHEFIMRLPLGYETRIGGMASGLSAGQAQLIAFARALYGDPSVLVLDEPNAFLDSEGERAVVEAMIAARDRGASVIVIAHRQAVLQPVDSLVLLGLGRTQVSGPRDEVLAKLTGPRPTGDES